jgi:hypothetical protein
MYNITVIKKRNEMISCDLFTLTQFYLPQGLMVSKYLSSCRHKRWTPTGNRVDRKGTEAKDIDQS